MRSAVAADTLLVLGDSLSAGYQMSIDQAWPSLLADKHKQDSRWPTIVNASISGDTSAQGLARLPELLKTHKPRWVLVELGANDGLRGFNVEDIRHNIDLIITEIQKAGAIPIIMQIQIPPNYGKRYTLEFADIFRERAHFYQIPYIPFFMEEVVTKPEWMLRDGIHPNELAQPFIANFIAEKLEFYFFQYPAKEQQTAG